MQTATQSSLEKCPDKLNDARIKQYQEEGYLAFSQVLQGGELEEARNALEKLCSRLVTGTDEEVEYKANISASTGQSSGASYRFKRGRCCMHLEAGFDPKGKDLPEIESHVRKYMWFCEDAEIFQRMMSVQHSILRIVSNLIGSNPLLFQEMALVKPAFIGTEKPWHQDDAYFSVAPLDAVVGVWIALDDAGIENGCMHVIPGGHHIGALQHYHGRDCEITEGRLDISKAVPVPIPAGGAMFFSGLMPHQTPPNRSPHRRRALQFHFRAQTSKIVDEETYNRIFVEGDGTPASCRAASKK